MSVFVVLCVYASLVLQPERPEYYGRGRQRKSSGYPYSSMQNAEPQICSFALFLPCFLVCGRTRSPVPTELSPGDRHPLQDGGNHRQECVVQDKNM